MGEKAYKTAWFAKAARKARITDSELRRVIGQIAAGQADNLGGGVFKKRLNDNRHRSIVLAGAGEYWVFVSSSQKKIAPISKTTNCVPFASWPMFIGTRSRSISKRN